MKLKALTLENFKGISDPVRIEFSPITLLFGPNNAGKSTVLHALIYAREIFERGNLNPRTTQMGGDTVDLGGFDSLVHNHDRSRRIRMRLEFDATPAELRQASVPKGFYPSDFRPLPKEEHRSWLNRKFQFVDGFWPSVSDALGALQISWIELLIGWSQAQAKPIIGVCAIGGSNQESPVARFAHNPKQRRIELTTLNFSQVPFGKCETPETRRMTCERAPIPLAQPAIPPAPTPLDAEQRRRLKDAAIANYIDSSTLLRGLIRPEFISPDGSLKCALSDWGTLGAEPGLGTVLPASNASPTFLELSYPEVGLPGTFDDDLVLQYAEENNPETSDWVDPIHVVSEFLDPLVTSIWVGTTNCCRELFRQSLHLSSVRVHPPRDFHPVEPLDPRRWPNGLAAWDLLVAEEGAIVEPLNEWLRGDPNRFDSGFRVEIQRAKQVDSCNPAISKLLAENSDVALEKVRDYLARLPEERLLRIRNMQSGVLGQPRDVGYGLSQLVPVIVAALSTEAGVVSVEEPEANIHPAFQVVLADLFITQSKANPNALFLIETHSEHLMLRLLRRIRESSKGLLPDGIPSVCPGDVAVHFVERTSDGPYIERKQIDEDGDFIDEWPGGFFEESFHEKFSGR